MMMIGTLSKKELAEIITRVSEIYNVPPRLLLSRRRTEHIAEARQMAMVVAYQRIGNYMEVGRLFNRDHGTVVHARDKIKSRLSYDKKLSRRWMAIADLATEPTPPDKGDYQI